MLPWSLALVIPLLAIGLVLWSLAKCLPQVVHEAPWPWSVGPWIIVVVKAVPFPQVLGISSYQVLRDRCPCKFSLPVGTPQVVPTTHISAGLGSGEVRVLAGRAPSRSLGVKNFRNSVIGGVLPRMTCPCPGCIRCPSVLLGNEWCMAMGKLLCRPCAATLGDAPG